MIRFLLFAFLSLSTIAEANVTITANVGMAGLDLNGLNTYLEKGDMGQFTSVLGGDTDNTIYGLDLLVDVGKFAMGGQFLKIAEEKANGSSTDEHAARIDGWWLNYQLGIDRRSEIFGFSALATLGMGKLILDLAPTYYTQTLTGEYKQAELKSDLTGESWYKALSLRQYRRRKFIYNRFYIRLHSQLYKEQMEI